MNRGHAAGSRSDLVQLVASPRPSVDWSDHCVGLLGTAVDAGGFRSTGIFLDARRLHGVFRSCRPRDGDGDDLERNAVVKPGDPAAVEQLFEAVAPRYDVLNDILSLGLHRHWKRQLVRSMKPGPGEIWLDLCCGTGDLALMLARGVRPSGRVIALDSASAPLERAQQRQRREPWLPVEWLQGDALDSGLKAGCADGAVMAYGLRNLQSPETGLREMRRLLRSGGRAGILDFNRLDPDDADGRFQRFYLRKLVVPIAASFGLREHYSYLEDSLKAFPDGREQESLALAAGFSKARHRSIVAGQMGLLLLQA